LQFFHHNPHRLHAGLTRSFSNRNRISNHLGKFSFAQLCRQVALKYFKFSNFYSS
jgi:hypothetical protein